MAALFSVCLTRLAVVSAVVSFSCFMVFDLHLAFLVLVSSWASACFRFVPLLSLDAVYYSINYHRTQPPKRKKVKKF